MKYTVALSCAALALGLSSQAIYADQNSADVTDTDRLNVSTALDKISKQVNKKLKASDIQSSPIPGLLQVTVDATIFYIYDGRYLLTGELLDLNRDRKSWSTTEEAIRKIRKGMLAALDPKDMIIFRAKKPQLAKVIVFTDLDCGYCHKLQQNIKQYNDLGIEVRYLAFPRNGPGSPGFTKAVTVWCSSNRQRDIALAMQGTDLPSKQCEDNPVAKQFELGVKLGVSGTPTMFLENGVKISGLASPEELVKLIKEQGN